MSHDTFVVGDVTFCRCCKARVWNCFCFGGMYADGKSYTCSADNHNIAEAMRRAGIEVRHP